MHPEVANFKGVVTGVKNLATSNAELPVVRTELELGSIQTRRNQHSNQCFTPPCKYENYRKILSKRKLREGA